MRPTITGKMAGIASGGLVGGIAAGAMAGGLTGPAGAAIGAIAGAVLFNIKQRYLTCHVELRDGRAFVASAKNEAWTAIEDAVSRAPAVLPMVPGPAPAITIEPTETFLKNTARVIASASGLKLPRT